MPVAITRAKIGETRQFLVLIRAIHGIFRPGDGIFSVVKDNVLTLFNDAPKKLQVKTQSGSRL
jgi:hypothetical protein